MSAQPVWITPAGSLGSIPQGAFYQVSLDVTEADSVPVYFKVVAGTLPSGIECTSVGNVQGVPTNVVSVGDVSTVENSINITSKFTIRAYTKKTVNNVSVVDRIADRTFTITVAGQNYPKWVTPPGEIGQYFTGSLLEPGYQLEFTNDNPDNIPPSITLVSGRLPPGLTLSSTGLISGFISNTAPSSGFSPDDTDGPSLNKQGFSDLPFDAGLPNNNSSRSNYQFTLKVTDGRTSALRTFSIVVWATSTFNASTTLLTADNSELTASIANVDIPVILNPQGSIGSVSDRTFFAYQFNARIAQNVAITYVGVNLPPGLTLNQNTGWLYGYLPTLSTTEITYDFTVSVYPIGHPESVSSPYRYSLTVVGPISTQANWISPSNLGTIANGDTSMFYVEAVSSSKLSLQYKLVSGSDSSLPQGLTLLPSGNIVGRVSFNTYALDGGTTTFDIASGKPTTFDKVYTFTVNAYSTHEYVTITKTFSITVERVYNKPYNNLYITCMPPQDDRQLIGSLVQDTSIFPQYSLYRPDDPNFGLSTSVKYYHCYGLNPVMQDSYITALQMNHYWKDLTLGPIETARAADPVTGEVLYEVIYSRIIDNLVNNDGVSVGKSVQVPFPINANTSDQINIVYPNALVDMRDQVISSIGQESDMLPMWMLSKQANGQVLGFVPAWVIAYVKPGESGQIAYNIQQQFETQLNLVDFKADRYEIDCALTVNWDAATQSWTPSPPTSTTFDANYHYDVLVATNQNETIGYRIGDELLISGSILGGTSGLNDLIITVMSVTPYGGILYASAKGTASMFASGRSYENVSATNVTGIGTGALWDVTVVPGVQTIFDEGSMDFNAPADTVVTDNSNDKYAMFPKRNILDPVPITGQQLVLWVNDSQLSSTWVNDSNASRSWAETRE